MLVRCAAKVIGLLIATYDECLFPILKDEAGSK